MPIEVVETPAVHEALILRIHRVLSPGGDRLANHFVHFGPALARECEEAFAVLRGVAQAASGERLEERLEQEHDVRLVADDHASGIVIAEFRIEVEAQGGEELPGLLQIANWQIDKKFSRMIPAAHRASSHVDRYAARCVNSALVATRIVVLAAPSAAKETGNQPRGSMGYQEAETLGWFKPIDRRASAKSSVRFSGPRSRRPTCQLE